MEGGGEGVNTSLGGRWLKGGVGGGLREREWVGRVRVKKGKYDHTEGPAKIQHQSEFWQWPTPLPCTTPPCSLVIQLYCV